jgi:hypothetical protein
LNVFLVADWGLPAVWPVKARLGSGAMAGVYGRITLPYGFGNDVNWAGLRPANPV